MNENIWNDENLIKTLRENGVVIMPTDTIYGMVGKAQNVEVVERIYKIRGRSPQKPCIILIGDINELEKFDIFLTEEKKKELGKYWGLDNNKVFEYTPTSIILDCTNDSLKYLHRGTNTLAFRIPRPQALRILLLGVGPLIAPSANQETFPPNDNVIDAKRYFGDSVDLYVDGGVLKNKPSKLIKLNTDGSVVVLRE